MPLRYKFVEMIEETVECRKNVNANSYLDRLFNSFDMFAYRITDLASYFEIRKEDRGFVFNILFPKYCVC